MHAVPQFCFPTSIEMQSTTEWQNLPLPLLIGTFLILLCIFWWNLFYKHRSSAVLIIEILPLHCFLCKVQFRGQQVLVEVGKIPIFSCFPSMRVCVCVVSIHWIPPLTVNFFLETFLETFLECFHQPYVIFVCNFVYTDKNLDIKFCNTEQWTVNTEQWNIDFSHSIWKILHRHRHCTWRPWQIADFFIWTTCEDFDWDPHRVWLSPLVIEASIHWYLISFTRKGCIGAGNNEDM